MHLDNFDVNKLTEIEDFMVNVGFGIRSGWRVGEHIEMAGHGICAFDNLDLLAIPRKQAWALLPSRRLDHAASREDSLRIRIQRSRTCGIVGRREDHDQCFV